ncbi:GntR family transcriptional regulator [Altererythrobacter sp. MF3-039]|uniref:GntR family transcriptional regulator n=1 Tax=Altererythrobacter sp. MF3-039 TaxID=3252901 RepID=UPI00390CA211
MASPALATQEDWPLAAANQPVSTKPIPRYVAVASELREEILADQYSKGTPFPTENELCKRYDVSRFTVREALRRLQAEGLIARKRGSGTTVQPAAARGGALHQPLSNVGELLQYARDSQVNFAEHGNGPLPEDIAEQLAEDTSGDWRCFRGVRTHSNSDQAIALTDAFFHERLGDTVDRVVLDSGTLFTQIEKIAGVRIGKVSQEIQAIAACSVIADALQVEEDSPVLRILRCYVDPKGNAFEVSVSYHPGDRFAYSMHIDVED